MRTIAPWWTQRQRIRRLTNDSAKQELPTKQPQLDMALQAGVSTSKVLILAGAGLFLPFPSLQLHYFHSWFKTLLYNSLNCLVHHLLPFLICDDLGFDPFEFPVWFFFFLGLIIWLCFFLDWFCEECLWIYMFVYLWCCSIVSALAIGCHFNCVFFGVFKGLTGSIILRNGRLSELIAQLQELLKGVDEVEIAPYKYDSALLSAQVILVVYFLLLFFFFVISLP